MSWRRYAGVVLAVALISMAGCSTIVDRYGGPAFDEADRAAAVDLAEGTASEIEQWRDDRITTARRLADTAALRSGDSERANIYLRGEVELSSDVYQVHLVNLDNGTILASTDRAKVREPLHTREAPWTTRSIEYGEDGVFVSDATEAQGRSLVSFVSPVETDGGDTVAVVVQSDVDTVAGDLPKPSEGVFSQIVDSQYRIVADNEETSYLERNDGLFPKYTQQGWNVTAVERGLDGYPGVVRDRATEQGPDEAYVTAYVPVEGVDWVVVVHLPISYEFPAG